ncbi:MurR/RpiR family transcriptional regulator, partial [Alcaligenes pakistanensis]
LASTYRRIPDSLLQEIAHAILAARKVWVLGFRSSQALASYFRWQLLQIVPEAQLIPGPGETMGEHLAGIHAEDVVVIFALRRRVRNMDQLI